ncbi:hypothetical protein [Stutzerimonas stutzeri]|uniref:hypothetical protein n=1 Tax=Stutzerimonas stutzeri TaxID=316 RepID=UPI000F77E85E|nr:hypothetical protein [Stutzerimonas stutzeri]MCP3432982.1 hypothetical protein [Stutzerimonas stutzeri]RRV61032.1 hypothetical protein EGJ08_05260 [Stutzerimonas stutzeri]RTM25055.1 hypothetical protein EKN22_04975 [Stutzerimonas stutzeri]
MARIYHRDQAGAPALTYNAASSVSADHFAAFKVILKAALVSGYGSIPAAGWSLVYESTTTLILRPGTKSGYVCFVRDSAITVVNVWLAATFEGVDANGKIIGDGVRSGVAANSAVPQRYSVRALVSYSVSTTWAIVADESAFVFSPSAGTSSAQEVTGTQGNGYEAVTLLYCGDDSAGDLICVGGQNVAAVSSSTNLASFSSAGFTALRFPHTGLLIDTASIALSMPGAQAGAPAMYSEWPAGTVLPEVSLTPLVWISSGVVRRLKGLAVDPRLLYVYNSQVSQALGGPVLTTRNMNNVLSLGDGHAYIVGRSYYWLAISALLTTNPEFW